MTTQPLSSTPAPTPRLILRLVGTWVQLDPHHPEATDRRIKSYVELALGRADELATARAEMRKALGLMVETGEGPAELQSAFLCHEMAPGVPAPIAISVFAPANLRISPAVGTAPGTVIDGFLAAMTALGDGDHWTRADCVGGQSVRRWRIEETPTGEGPDDPVLRTFGADYWRTVPGTKNLVLITVTSPLADIPETLLRLADAVVAGSRFAPPAE